MDKDVVLKNVYEKTDQAVYHIIEKMDYVFKEIKVGMTTKEKVLFHKRYEWLVTYLRHYRLEEDCLKPPMLYLNGIGSTEEINPDEEYDPWSDEEN